MNDMKRLPIFSAARVLRAAFFLALPLAANLAVAGAQNAQPHATASSQTAAAAKRPPVVKPLWSELTPEQQQALAPLAGEWDSLDTFRKNKWLAIGNKFPSMKPEEQQRLQERMREWLKLTPEQRRVARENYVRAQKLRPDQKSAQWEQYQQLPEEEKKKLAADAAAKKKVTTLPPPSAHNKQVKTIPPIKAAPKPVIEQSVTPQAVNQSALQPIVPVNSKQDNR
ncbi:DUF3106 domain-containing protein [Herbaspirillum sp. HC18]|nr:DUF3106 domain-containing protein [Herbaspirillum sp. HC18]